MPPPLPPTHPRHCHSSHPAALARTVVRHPLLSIHTHTHTYTKSDSRTRGFPYPRPLTLPVPHPYTPFNESQFIYPPIFFSFRSLSPVSPVVTLFFFLLTVIPSRFYSYTVLCIVHIRPRIFCYYNVLYFIVRVFYQ